MLLQILIIALAASPSAPPADAQPDLRPRVGIKLRGGGRYDDVRMCVATPAGVRGGMAGDISLLFELPVGRRVALHFDIPVMRPIVFATATQMLQLEPSAGVLFRAATAPRVHVVGGPVLGLSLHYGPGVDSEPSGPGRTADFFAAGPILGGYVGLDFVRPGRVFNFQLGLSPYVTPLWRPDGEAGVVVGGLLDASFRFAVGRGRSASGRSQ